MPMVQLSCEECGKSFTSHASARRRFCSGHCKAVAQHRRMREAGTTLKGGPLRHGDQFACSMCKRTFYRSPVQIDRERQYCSVRCADGAKIKGVSVKPCRVCGTEMRLLPSQAMRLYCSHECKGTGRIQRPLERMHNGRCAKKDKAGYVMLWEPEHPNKSMHGWQYEHRLVAEQVLGRYLASDEHVHHKNGLKGDNHPANLEVMGALDHAALSARDYRDQVARDREELAALRAEVERLRGK